MDVAVLTYSDMPELAEFERPLLPALRALGLDARPVVWDDPTVDFKSVRLAVVRSTWDSHLRRDTFVAWAQKVGRLTKLHNPADVLRWNTHKFYLRELEEKGIPVTPTAWVEREGTLDLEILARARGWDTLVLKPAVSAGAVETHIIPRAEAAAGNALVTRLAASGELMVQPYLRAFESEGERSYIFFDGAFSHAVRRPPTLKSAPRGFAEPTVFAPDAKELKLSERVLEAMGAPLLYARVDVATDNEGVTRLQEVEVTEPSLFLTLDAESPHRLARAIAAKL
ncbi:ATP-grasp domain-containing protein [Myxococcus fulvus]|uniref:ATP-grasp domain-containing protein n=1 Tax=Myxococcus fulvus TaxID=33 RepID=UPI003B9B28F5